MRALKTRASLALLVVLCTGCPFRKASPPAQQAQAPPLQSGSGTLSPPKTTQQPETTSPLASPLPPPSAQSVPLPPPPPPKKVRHRVKTPKPADPPPTPAAAPGASSSPSTPGAQVATQSTPPQQTGADHVAASPIGQLTTGDSALGERTKHETADLIGETQQGLNAIKRALSTEEKVTAAQIRTFLKQAQQALDSGDSDGGHTLATKAKLLLDELTKP
jgi:hypothetical protein